MRAKQFFSFFFFLFLPFMLLAAPDEERLPSSEGAPLNLFSSQVTDMIVPKNGDFANRLIIAAVGSDVVIIDTETWELYEDQPTAFGGTIGGLALLANGTTLVVTLDDGDLARIELDEIAEENEEIGGSDESSETTDDTTDDSEETTDTEEESDSTSTSDDPRLIDLSENTSEGPLGAIVADPDAGDSIVYFINTTDNILYSYDIEEETLVPLTLDATPHDVVFADTDSGEKIYVPAASGKIFLLTVGGSSVATLSVSITDSQDEANPELTAAAVSPDADYLYVLDTTNDAVWVWGTNGNSLEDQQSGGATDPIRIESDENGALLDILITSVTNPDEIYGYVSGESGLTLLSAGTPTVITSNRKIIDLDDSTSDVLDPLTLSGSPGPLAASTSDDGFLYSSNGNAEISVVSDNPFVTISADTDISLDGDTTSFTITFQSDEEGTYRVVANSDVTGASGEELIAATALDGATQVDADVVTATIETNDFDRDVFVEGENRIFVFVEDSEGNTGRDAVDITMDRPPPEVDVTGSNFGREKAYATFDKLSDADINTYHIVAKQAVNQASPDCPGTLDFTDSPDGDGTVDHDDCLDSCEGSADGLTNGVAYCVAVRAEDDGGQLGPFGYSADAVTPERTVGPAGILGEAGCSLRKTIDNRPKTIDFGIIFILCINLFVLYLLKKYALLVAKGGWRGTPPSPLRPCSGQAFPLPRGERVGERVTSVKTLGVFIIFLFLALPLHAEETLPKEGSKWFSFEAKGGLWFPQNATVADFYGACCNITGDLEFGFLYKSQFNATVAVGIGYETGSAVGVDSGAASGDAVHLLMIPIRNNFIYRFDYLSEQLLVPYIGAGLDYVYFRESVAGDSVKGLKLGFHGMGGLAILLDRAEDIGSGLSEAGVDDVYLTLEGRYSKIDSFKSTGLDLSSIQAYLGVLLAF